MANQMDRLLSQKQVVEWTGMSSAFFEVSRFKGTGIPYIKIGRAVRYRESSVLKWLAEREVTTSK